MRVVWRGTISFGLVTIPVRLYVATESKNVPSHQIHVSDGGRVQYKRVCSIDGAEVPYEEIGRGYESATGELVVLSDSDLATLPAKTSRSIEIVSFLPMDAVDPIYFDRSYYVEPERQGAKAYRLMRDALRKLGRIAVAKVSLRDREIIGVLRANADVLVLATMLWPDEVRKPKFPFLAESDEWVTPTQELAMAEALIDSLSDDQLDPARYRDVHRETLTALIDAKATGRVPAADVGSGAAPPDLLGALRASIEAAKQRRSTGNGGPRRTAEPVGTAKKRGKNPAEAGHEVRPPKKRG
ncbi:MAG TPA: Ku protein [Propionibacteriaceae bacterium]|nr:Ku protein [Propionibacteriaceae bacterium]